MFIPCNGLRYTRFLRRAHAATLVDWYMEVGCRTGRSMAGVRSKTIAVDPFFQIEQNVIGAKPAFHSFQTTSDAFFQSGFLENNEIALSLSFLDGMHLFEFLLRDFISTEANSLPEGVIALHDCIPSDHAMTTRDLDNLPSGGWTGDVWKLLPILAAYRPDLSVKVLDCAPTGLVMVSNLDPADTTLAENYEAILADYLELSLEAYGVSRFFDGFDLLDAKAVANDGFRMLDGVRLGADLALSPQKITP